MTFLSKFLSRLPFRSSTRYAATSSVSSRFVPKHDPVTEEDVELVERLISQGHPICVLTGAGISTESGLPDYRSHEVGLFARTTYKPITIQAFVGDAERRQGYWARNYLAWPSFRDFKPNVSHEILAKWQSKGIVSSLVTQNVDTLHQKAGSKDVVELHGNSFTIHCMKCSYKIERDNFQKVLDFLNPDFKVGVKQGLEIRPDGDINISTEVAHTFKYPDCPTCKGLLKPSVVFFGDNVQKDVVDNVYKGIQGCKLMLILGSSLEVYSGYRFLLHALENKKTIVIVNIGPTRADRLMHSKTGLHFIRARVGDVLSKISV
jgi:NAD-dependent deacetylase sirtuin 4